MECKEKIPLEMGVAPRYKKLLLFLLLTLLKILTLLILTL